MATLQESAAAHGLPVFLALKNVNVSYAGHWRWLVGKLQPSLVDAEFRGGSQERISLPAGIVAQAHTGPHGHKQVVRTLQQGADIQVWFNGEAAHDRERLDAAALVADAYALFLFGTMLLVANKMPRRDMDLALAGSSEVTQGGKSHACRILRVAIRPGLGNSESDELALYLDASSLLLRRVRMTLNGLESTRGALVDIDTYEHRSIHDIMWPTTFHERLLRPAPLDVHAWRLTGLDVDRDEPAGQINGVSFTGSAVPPAAPLPPV